MKRTHHCSELTKANAGTEVVLIGWIATLRDHGGIIFIDLRDREGLTQIVFDPIEFESIENLKLLKPESVIEIAGEVKPRSEETLNKNLKTGGIEVFAQSLIIHNISDVPPFPLEDEKADKVNEDLRLTYRYLDLRRPQSYNRLLSRHKASKSTRDYMDENGFLEIETPELFKSTPEGAREFLVPSRLNPGEFYALVQSPQQYKQMLMVAGVERYYQMARCFRDEDLRADRQPEFTQIDIEMSFIDREDMYKLIEGLLQRIWKDVIDVDLELPFPHMSYHDAMNQYGVDKPDTRFDLKIEDFSDTFKDSEFKVFSGTIKNNGVVKAFNAKGLADITQGELKSLEEAAKSMGAKGLAFIKAEGREWKSPIVKFFSEQEKSMLKEKLEVEDGDIIFFAAANWEQACGILGRIRLDSAQLLRKRGLLSIPDDQFNFLWVTDFPLMLFDQDEQRYVSTHHPFTSPVTEDIPKLESDPRSVRGQHYDIVLNGSEIGGGSIRIHQPDLQKKVFEDFLKIPPEDVKQQFGYMLQAFHYGAPPHGGIALGFDRLIAIITGASSIRDVIAFPKTQKGQCLMTESPSAVTQKQLQDLNINSTAT
jgi:aspartyl-tRNA synthetase